MTQSFSMSKSPRQIAVLYGIVLLSGFAGLGYEMVWTRMLTIGLGHEMPAVLAVVAAFFSGMALGAYSLDGIVSRSRVPGRWYVALELSVGIWSLLRNLMVPPANRLVSTLMGMSPTPLRHWAIAFIAPFLILLLATGAYGCHPSCG